ncbi:MAG: gliding motility protein GldM, partial [Flavobacteriales bacterium]
MAKTLNPRQRMINLMYLIFIALLALNISKKVLTAFGLTNDALKESNKIATMENRLLYENLGIKSRDQPTKFDSLYKKAKEVVVLSNGLYDYTESIKTDLYASYGFAENSKEFERMDQSDALDDMLFEGAGLSKKGKAFEREMETYKNGMVALLDPEKDRGLIERIKELFNTEPESANGIKKTWLSARFEGFPMVASATTLSEIQSNIRSMEFQVISNWLEGQLSRETSYLNYSTILHTDKTTFFKGQNFQGSIVLGRADNSTQPHSVELTLDDKPLDTGDYKLEGGRVVLDFPVNDVGEHRIKGNLIFVENGKGISVPVNSSFAVIAAPHAAVISADRMNVLYRGVDNPVSISIPGLPDNKIRVSAPGFRKVGTGKYMANVTAFKGRTLHVIASATLPQGKKINPSKVFRIKDIPAPEGTIRGQAEARMPIGSFVKSTVGAALPDFPFDLKLNVTSFVVKIAGRPSIPVSGNRMNARVRRAVSRVRVGDQIT